MEITAPEEITAHYFTRVDDVMLSRLAVMGPYENKTAPSVWARGNIRIANYHGNGHFEQFVITGPRMKILYGGCRWNKIVFAMDHNDPACIDFVNWVGKVSDIVKTNIWSAPEKFKPGSKSNSRFVFENDIFKASSEPGIYSDEIRFRIASRRGAVEGTGETIDIPEVEFYKLGYDFSREKVEPYEIRSGGSMIPMIKVSYFRNGDKFGLTLTVLKGLYSPPDINSPQSMELDLGNVPN